MKRKTASIFLFLLIISVQALFGQYTTPNTGQKYRLYELVPISGGAVSYDTSGALLINNDLTIAANDTLLFDSAMLVLMDNDVLLTSLGVLIVDPVQNGSMTDLIMRSRVQGVANHFLGLRIEDQDGTYLRRLILDEAGGLRILNADILIDSCRFLNFDQSNSTAAINLFQSNTRIQNSIFRNLEGPAIASGANVFSAPKIYNNLIELSNSSNSNNPLINLGPSGPNDTTFIKGNTISGFYDNAGGISASNLLGIANQNVVIDSNVIENNRYGITCTGSNINAIITRNAIIDNNIQNNPNLGGSGLNFNGGNSNIAFVAQNYIAGNLWGVTIQGNAKPNLGDSQNANTGYNCFENNGNGGVIYALYNNTPDPISAQFNDWGDSIPEDVIFHNTDDMSLGLVDFSSNQLGITNITPDFTYLIINDSIYFTNTSIGDVIEFKWQTSGNNFSYDENPVLNISGLQGPSVLVTLEVRGYCTINDTSILADFDCRYWLSDTVLNYVLDSLTGEVEFFASAISDSSANTLQYLWNFGDGNTAIGQQAINNYQSAGQYLVELSLINVCGDTLVISDSVEVKMLSATQKRISKKSIIHPNPAIEVLKISARDLKYAEVMDLQGKIWIREKLSNSGGEIKIQELKDGVYLLKLMNSKGEVAVHKFLKSSF